MKKHPTASEVFASAIANWRIVILGMMIAVLTTTTFYFITVYAPGFGKELKLSASDTLLVTLLVAVTNFIWNPVGGAVSDRIGRKPVLVAIAALSFLTAYPALSWLAAAPSASFWQSR
jgi:MHS family citrate/tricarballylate:H+ symporter-like MFS transporter